MKANGTKNHMNLNKTSTQEKDTLKKIAISKNYAVMPFLGKMAKKRLFRKSRKIFTVGKLF